MGVKNLSLGGKDRRAKDVEPRINAQPRRGRGGHSSVFALRRSRSGAYGDVAIEVGGGKKKFRRSRLRQMRNRSGGDIAAPGIFDRQRDTQRNAQIANLPRASESTDFRDFE